MIAPSKPSVFETSPGAREDRPLTSLALLGAGLALVLVMIWGMIEYIGPYRWLAELQIRIFGDYMPAATVILPLLAVSAPLIGVGAAMSCREARYQAGCSLIAFLFAIGLCSIGGTQINKLAWQPSLHDPLQTIDLATMDSQSPPPVHARLMGEADRARALEIKWRGKTAWHQQIYTPMVPSRQDPVRFVVVSSSIDPQGSPRGAEDNPEGLLQPGGLPNEVRVRLQRSGVTLAREVHLLRLSRDSEIGAWVTAVLCELTGLLILLLSLTSAVRSIRNR